jgi:hypothetical protein
MPNTSQSPLAAIEEKRAARKAARQAELELQKAIDLEAIDALEVEHGDDNIAVLEVPFTPGSPIMVAARCPSSAEFKRYRARLKEKNPDPIKAAEELGTSCRVYPDATAFETLLAARAGILTQLGVAAVQLATGRAVEEGKG